MKFVSKASNYCLILKAGFPANYSLGTPSVPAISVRFENGVAVIEDPQHVQLMLKNRAHGRDYFSVEDEAKDPFVDKRKETEPGHYIQDLSTGRPGQAMGSPVKVPESVMNLAKSMAADMAKGMIKEMLPDIVATIKKDLEGDKPKEIQQEVKKVVSKKNKAPEPAVEIAGETVA